MSAAREKVELVDGSVYWSDDGWLTVMRQLRSGRMTRTVVVTGTEADRIRYIAVVQHGGGRNEATKGQ